jgi:hypothetical protein
MTARILLAISLAALSLTAATIWIEGEDAVSRDNAPHPWWYDKVKTDALSGGAWLSNFTKEKDATALYEFQITEPGAYTFWLRCNPHSAKIACQLDSNDWQDLDVRLGSREYANIAEDNKPDLRFLAWCQPATFDLTAGRHTLRLRFGSGPDHQGAIDCFAFSNDGFVPSGKTKPSEFGMKEVLAGPDAALWLEAEDAAHIAVNPNSWYDSVNTNALAGGAWVSHFGAAREGRVTFDVSITQPDTYRLWVRANPISAKLSWRIDSNDWQLIDTATAREQQNIARDGKADLRFIAWLDAGRVMLSAGVHTLSFRMHSDNNYHGGLDCAVLTRVPFTPSGLQRPTVLVSANDPDDWFSVVAGDDAFSPASVIDMSKYIEAPAGKYGFLQRVHDSLKFEHATNTIKFWACGANLQYGTYSRAQQLQRIRYLKKYGVNMVRQHPVFAEIGRLRNGHFDPARLDEFDWWFAALKSNGVYVTWSVFYPLLISAEDGYDPALFKELLDQGNGLRSTYGIVNVSRELQDIQLRYLTALLQHTNSYTGLRYSDDPALAVIEIQNEDCVFFHNPLGDLAGAKKYPLHSKRLRQQWFAWVTNRYGDKAAVEKAWGGLQRGDAFDDGELLWMAAYHLGGAGPLYEYASKTRRAGDFIEFLTELQHDFYARREREMRALGVKCITVSTAWRAGGAAADPANTYCDTVCDMIDRHNYAGGGDGGHAVVNGRVNIASHLSKPGSGLLASGLYQVEDRPFALSEWSQCPPNPWKAEAAPLIAFYGMGLQGWDVAHHFLNSRRRIGDGWPNLSKYVTDTPHYIGQFPALFFALHHGHITEAPPASARRITVADLFTGKDILQQDLTGGSHDYKQAQGTLATPEAVLAIGKVTTGFTGGISTNSNWSRYWDTTAKRVRSMTGELEWDYDRQCVLVKTPKTQAIIGRTDAQPVALPGVDVTLATPFAVLMFTPLDNQALTVSTQILITAMARDKQAGAEFNADWSQLKLLGAPPLMMEPVQARIKVRGATPQRINVLDIYGVPTGATVPVTDDGDFAIDGRYRTYYYEVRR